MAPAGERVNIRRDVKLVDGLGARAAERAEGAAVEASLKGQRRKLGRA